MDSVDAFISSLPNQQARLVQEIRALLIGSMPHYQEKINYKIPFYYYLKWFCYLNVPPKQSNKVVLGFCQGAQLSNSQGILVGDGKMVRHIEFHVDEDYDEQLVREVIQEGILLQELLYKKKN